MQKIIITYQCLLVRVFSFLSIAIVKDVLLLVIVASEVAKVETIQKLKNDVRKIPGKKKYSYKK